MADIFEKCFEFKQAEDAREKGIYTYFHALESRQDVEVMMEGKRRIMTSSRTTISGSRWTRR